MGVVCVDTLGLGRICYILSSLGVTIVVLCMERNKLRGPASICSMPRQKYPNLLKRSLCVLSAFEPDPKCLVNSFQEIRLLCGNVLYWMTYIHLVVLAINGRPSKL
jgi:hypothetical protein